MTRTYTTAIWLALLFIAVTETQAEMRHYEQRALGYEFDHISAILADRPAKKKDTSNKARVARYVANRTEKISQQFTVALAIAGVAGAFHTSGVWWLLMGGSIFAAGRAGYQAAQAMGVIG